MKNGSKINEHLDNYTKLFVNVRSVGVKIYDEYMVFILLKSLPHFYRHWVQTLTNDNTISYHAVSSKLINLEF